MEQKVLQINNETSLQKKVHTVIKDTANPALSLVRTDTRAPKVPSFADILDSFAPKHLFDVILAKTRNFHTQKPDPNNLVKSWKNTTGPRSDT